MTETNKQGRNRRTREEMIAAVEAKLARLKAQAEGTYDETADDTFLVKSLKRAIRSRETAIKQSQTLLRGRAGTEKSPAVADIEQKIANAENRVMNLHAAKARALEMEARLPFDVQNLRELLERAEKGETVNMPTDLYILPNQADRTDAEIEAGTVLTSDES